jgi:CRISPR type IV-associated DEAD/DEAH-box helicase Csf4
MRTKGYLPSQRSELRLSVKSKVVALLDDENAKEFERIPTQRASTHESVWMSEAQVSRAVALGKAFGLSVGESITSLLLRDFDEWESKQAKLDEPSIASSDDSGALGRALANAGKQLRKEQLQVLRAMRSLTQGEAGAGKVLFCEAGTGTGKTLAYLGAAVELLGAAPLKRVIVAAPTFALIEQIEAELSLFRDEAPKAVFLAGQSEWVSETALETFLEERAEEIPEAQAKQLRRWMTRGGDGSRPRWSMVSLVETVPAFAFVNDVNVAKRVGDDDRGYEAYVGQFAKAADARLVVMTHSMLAWLVKRRMLAQFKELGGNENVADAIAAWKSTSSKEREQRFHEALNLAMAEEGSDAGCDRLPNADWLVVDEAHALEDAFANVFSVDGSVGSLLSDASALHKASPATFDKNGLDRLREVFSILKDLCKGRGADDVLNLGDMPGLMNEIVEALTQAVTPKPGASKKKAAAASSMRESKRIRAMASSLSVASESLQKGATWAAAYLHWSPMREYPRISVGKLWLDQELHYLWGVVANRTALVSGTLYEENPSYSCETARRALAVPTANVMPMVPIHARWQVEPVELRMIQAVHAPDGRARFCRPAAKMQAVERNALGQKWLDDVSGYVRELIVLNATTGGVLVLGAAFEDIAAVETRLLSEAGLPAGWTLLAQRPGTGLAGLRKEFLDASRNGKVILLAVGGAWTGFDLHSAEVPDALTDLVMLNAPFGLMGKTVARLRRQAGKNGHFEVAAHALLLVRQGVGRLVRSPETAHNRRIHWLDARIHDPGMAGMFYGVKRFLARYRSLAVG